MHETDAPSHHRLITASVILATVLQTVDLTIANVALPHIGGSLSASYEEIEWVLTSYIVASAIMMPLAAWLAGRYGRKKVLVVSIVGFTVSSMLCGAAHSIDQIVLFRFLQGASGAGLIPLCQAVLLDINPPERHGRAMSLWGQGVVLGPMVAPVVGGWLTDNYSWRWVFYINAPLGVVATLGIVAYVAETRPRYARFDFLGFGALAVAVAALQLLLDRGQLRDWFDSTEIRLEAFVAIAAFYVFVVQTLTARSSFVSPGLFRNRNFTVASFLIFVVGMVLLATLALLPPLLEDLLGFPVTAAGVAMIPRGLGNLISATLAGHLIGRIDSRAIIATGLGLIALALAMMCGYSTQMPQQLVWSSTFLQGLGTGLAYVTLATVAFSTLGPHSRSESTSIFNLVRNIGSSIGIAATQTLFTRNTQIVHAQLAAHIVPYGGQIRLPPPFSLTSPAGLAALNQAVTRQAQMIAYNDDAKLLFVMTLALIPLLMLLQPTRARASEPAVVE